MALRKIDLGKARVARAETIRNVNRLIVLNYIRERAPISRAQISSATALQRSTVSRIVDELKYLNLIAEGEGETSGGRPPTLLRLQSTSPIALGVDLEARRTLIATSDLSGRLLEQDSFATEPDVRANTRKIIAVVNRFLRRYKTIEGIGISVPGLVEPQTGKARFVPHFNWVDWDVGNQVEKATAMPVTVDNDANAGALAELWFGRPEVRQLRTFIFVLVESGLGTGIVLDGEVYHGFAGASGEFGHMTIGRRGPVACAAGNFDCWEAFASERAALARYPKMTRRLTFAELIQRALKGESASRRVLARTGHYLGIGITNLLKGLNPEGIIVGGLIARAWPLIESEIFKIVEEDPICRALPAARIIPSTLGENARIMGAIGLVLASKFSPAHLV